MRRITYFAPFLCDYSKYKRIWVQIESVLRSENELYNFVPNAKDIWVRDFMPVQRHDGKFLIYRYNPDYLKGKNDKYRTNCRDAFIEIGAADILSSDLSVHTNLVIDGGNMIKCIDKNGTDCIVMTSKVLYENPGLSQHEILLELEECMNAEVIIIPWDRYEIFGHSDGMVRSLGNGKLLLNNYAEIDKQLGRTIRNILSDRFDLCELTYGYKCRDRSWCHLNYLELDNIVLVPTASIASDRLAVEQIERYTNKRCVPISMSPIISDGGAMHCISWRIDTSIISENNLYFNHPEFIQQCH